MDVTRRDLRAHLGVEALKQLPGIGFEIAEDREVVSLVRIVDKLGPRDVTPATQRSIE